MKTLLFLFVLILGTQLNAQSSTIDHTKIYPESFDDVISLTQLPKGTKVDIIPMPNGSRIITEIRIKGNIPINLLEVLKERKMFTVEADQENGFISLKMPNAGTQIIYKGTTVDFKYKLTLYVPESMTAR